MGHVLIKLICEMKSKIKFRVLIFYITMQMRVADLSCKVVKDKNSTSNNF